MLVLIALGEAAGHPVSKVGGKAHALARLMEFGTAVPRGFVVLPEADITEYSARIYRAFDALDAEFVAVRSSAAAEDSAGQSWAGQFESYLYVQRRDLLERIAGCRDSGRSARAAAYDQSGHIMPVAVVVQAMVSANVSGVLFTANPVTGNRDQIMIEAVYGLGEQLVQGMATPDNYLLHKSTGRLLSQTIARKTTRLMGGAGSTKSEPVPSQLQSDPALSAIQLSDLAKLSAHLEAKFGYPLDIEFAYAKGKLFILQARPITTL